MSNNNVTKTVGGVAANGTYKIEQRSKGFVIKNSREVIVSCHMTKEAADKHLRTLEARTKRNG